MSGKKRVFQLLFFALVTGITLYVVFSGQDLSALIQGIRRLDPVSLILAVALGVLFVSMEGIMIWHLLRSMNGKSSLRQCICYSFIGFFYSGITPSATGGQPMQLYYMCKDGNKASDSSLVLMTVAAFYKFVLVLIGIVTALLWGRRIREYLGTYEPVFWLGLFLNSALVAMIVCLMVMPRIMEKIAFGVLDLVYRVKNRKKRGGNHFLPENRIPVRRNLLKRTWGIKKKKFPVLLEVIRNRRIISKKIKGFFSVSSF